MKLFVENAFKLGNIHNISFWMSDNNNNKKSIYNSPTLVKIKSLLTTIDNELFLLAWCR